MHCEGEPEKQLPCYHTSKVTFNPRVTFDLSGKLGQESLGQERAQRERHVSGVIQTVILQNYRSFRHVARPPGLVIHLGVYVLFQMKNRHTALLLPPNQILSEYQMTHRFWVAYEWDRVLFSDTTPAQSPTQNHHLPLLREANLTPLLWPLSLPPPRMSVPWALLIALHQLFGNPGI